MRDNLARKILNNSGLIGLTTPDEQKEIELVAFGSPHSLDSRIRVAELKKRKIIFAYFQDDFKGGKIAYWHCTNPFSKSYKSTLSMEGLRQWKVL